jgi:hypothetical protein
MAMNVGNDGQEGPDILNSGGKGEVDRSGKDRSGKKGAGEKPQPGKQQRGTAPSRGLDDPMNDVPGRPPKDSTWNP